MKITLKIILGLCSIVLLVPDASAQIKVDHSALGEIETVALVGYSFYRVVEMEPASPFKLKRQFVELTPEDPEYLMMQEADNQVVALLQGIQPQKLIPQNDVFANEMYQSLSKDPTKRINLSWYFPENFRDLKEDKSNAVKLAEALNVDAVLWVQFTHKESESNTTTLGAFGKSKKFIRLKGEVTLYDRTGSKIISGSVKSEKILKSSRRAIGAVGEYASGIEIETSKNTIADDDLWFPLLESYMAALEKELTK